MEILIYVLIFLAGVSIGFLVKKGVFSKNSRHSGTILVSKDEGKLTYSLELDENPEELQFKKEVVFKVNASD